MLTRVYSERARRHIMFGTPLVDPHAQPPTILERALAQSRIEASAIVAAEKDRVAASGGHWGIDRELWEHGTYVAAADDAEEKALAQQRTIELPNALEYVRRTTARMANTTPAPRSEAWTDGEWEIGRRLAETRARAALDSERSASLGEPRSLEYANALREEQARVVAEQIKDRWVKEAIARPGEERDSMDHLLNAETPDARADARNRLATQRGETPPGPKVAYTDEEKFVGGELAYATATSRWARVQAEVTGTPAAPAADYNGLVDRSAARFRQMQLAVEKAEAARALEGGVEHQGPTSGPSATPGHSDNGPEPGPGDTHGPNNPQGGPNPQGPPPQGPDSPGGGGGGGTPRRTGPRSGPGGGGGARLPAGEHPTRALDRSFTDTASSPSGPAQDPATATSEQAQQQGQLPRGAGQERRARRTPHVSSGGSGPAPAARRALLRGGTTAGVRTESPGAPGAGAIAALRKLRGLTSGTPSTKSPSSPSSPRGTGMSSPTPRDTPTSTGTSTGRGGRSATPSGRPDPGATRGGRGANTSGRGANTSGAGRPALGRGAITRGATGPGA